MLRRIGGIHFRHGHKAGGSSDEATESTRSQFALMRTPPGASDAGALLGQDLDVSFAINSCQFITATLPSRFVNSLRSWGR